MSRSEKTWKPPESVRIGPSQLMKACRPPSSAIRSSPGRKCRWYVLPSSIVVPIARSSSGSTDFTVAFVPTGMKAGVGTSPCAVCSTPARAGPSVAASVKQLMPSSVTASAASSAWPDPPARDRCVGRRLKPHPTSNPPSSQTGLRAVRLVQRAPDQFRAAQPRLAASPTRYATCSGSSITCDLTRMSHVYPWATDAYVRLRHRISIASPNE